MAELAKKLQPEDMQINDEPTDTRPKLRILKDDDLKDVPKPDEVGHVSEAEEPEVSRKVEKPSPFSKADWKTEKQNLKEFPAQVFAETPKGVYVEGDVITSAPKIEKGASRETRQMLEEIKEMKETYKAAKPSDLQDAMKELRKEEDIPVVKDVLTAEDKREMAEVKALEEGGERKKGMVAESSVEQNFFNKAEDESFEELERSEVDANLQTTELSSYGERIEALKLELNSKSEELREKEEEKKKTKLYQVKKKWVLGGQIKGLRKDIEALKENISIIEEATDKPVSMSVRGVGAHRESNVTRDKKSEQKAA